MRFGSIVAVDEILKDYEALRDLSFFSEIGKVAEGKEKVKVPFRVRNALGRLSLDTLISNVIAHELAHTLCMAEGPPGSHFADADGNGTPNEGEIDQTMFTAGDFCTVLFDYEQDLQDDDLQNYWFQDYFNPKIKYGPGKEDGLLKFLDIDSDTLIRYTPVD
jgi:hypothetical protein